MSPQLVSTSFLCFFSEFCCPGHPFKSILEFMSNFYWKQLMFLFSIFLLDDFQEEEKTEIMVISKAPIGKQKIFTEVNIQVLN